MGASCWVHPAPLQCPLTLALPRHLGPPSPTPPRAQCPPSPGPKATVETGTETVTRPLCRPSTCGLCACRPPCPRCTQGLCSTLALARPPSPQRRLRRGNDQGVWGPAMGPQLRARARPRATWATVVGTSSSSEGSRGRRDWPQCALGDRDGMLCNRRWQIVSVQVIDCRGSTHGYQCTFDRTNRI